MSYLQIALLILGAAVIVGVIAYNYFQEMRFRKRAESALGGARSDVLLEPAAPPERVERIEPHIEQRTQPEPEEIPVGRVEPVGMPATQPIVAAASETPPEDSPIDYSVRIVAEQPLQASALEQLAEAVEALARRPHVLVNLADGRWAPPAQAPAGGKELRISLQLADRRGHVTAAELTAFHDALAVWAQSVGATVEAPDPARYGEIAQELDRFCADVDVVIGLSVVAASGEPFSGTKVRGCAEASGGRFDNGVFRFDDAEGKRQFSLEDQQGEAFDPQRMRTAAINGVTLLLDVPRLDQGVAMFDRMVEAGRQLAICLGGTLVDDNRVAVTEAGLEQIRVQLRHIYAGMEARGIRAGGDLALRLFS